MPQMQRMLYRDSAEAGKKETKLRHHRNYAVKPEERGKAESKREGKVIISSLNSI